MSSNEIDYDRLRRSRNGTSFHQGLKDEEIFMVGGEKGNVENSEEY